MIEECNFCGRNNNNVKYISMYNNNIIIFKVMNAPFTSGTTASTKKSKIILNRKAKVKHLTSKFLFSNVKYS